MKDYRNISARKWHIICYDKAVVDAIIAKATRWAYILHDRDMKPDGTPKPPHYHVYVYRRNDTLGSFFQKLGALASPDNPTVRVAIQSEASECIKYFQHKTADAIAENKVPYEYSEIVFDKNDDHYLSFAEASFKREQTYKLKQAEKRARLSEEGAEFLNDLIIHHNNPAYMFMRYGRDYAINRDKYERFRAAIVETPIEELQGLSEAALEVIVQETPEPILRHYDIDLGDMLFTLSGLETQSHELLHSSHPDRIKKLSQIMDERLLLEETIRMYCNLKRYPDRHTPAGHELFEASLEAYLTQDERQYL